MENKIIDDINKAIIYRASIKPARSYMGASGLGEPCDAKLWYSYKMPKPVLDPRINRIFDIGNILEEYIISLFSDAGYKIHFQDEDKKQFGFTDGIIAGHIDGVIETDEPMLIEFKTFNSGRFEKFKKYGVGKSDPKYYTQVCVYMEKMDLDKCVFFGINKDNSDIHIEIISSDPIEANWAVNRGKEIGELNGPPKRKYDHRSSLACKMCDYRSECWADET